MLTTLIPTPPHPTPPRPTQGLNWSLRQALLTLINNMMVANFKEEDALCASLLQQFAQERFYREAHGSPVPGVRKVVSSLIKYQNAIRPGSFALRPCTAFLSSQG